MAVRNPSTILQIQKHLFSRVITKLCPYKTNKTFLVLIWNPVEIIVLRDNELHATVSSDIPVYDACCVKKHGLHLVALTSEGQLYNLSLPTSKKKQHRKDVPSSQIFTDLLTAQDESEKLKPYHELKLQDGDMIEHKDGAVSFIWSQESVIAFSKNRLGWQLERCAENQRAISIPDIVSQTVTPLQLCDFVFPIKPVLTEINTLESGLKNALDDTLFSGLLGMDTNLSQEAVAIIGLPNGTVYWTQLASSDSAQILYCLDEPVVAIHTMKISSKSPGDNCLVLAGQEGKLVLITVDNKSKIVYDVTFIHNPVLASAVCDKRLVHSTGKTVCITDVGVIFARCTNEKAAKTGAQSGCRIGAFCNVFGFVITDQQVPDDVGGVEILAVTKLGRVMPLQIRSSVHHNAHSPGDVKDKLTAIHTLTQAVQDVEQKMAEKDGILQQLSLISLLATRPPNPPVLIQHKITTTDMGSHQKHVLQVKLQNMSPITLSQGWTIGITLQSCVFESQTFGYSVTLPPNLATKAWEQVDIAFTDDMLGMLPVKLTVTLLFTFPHDDMTKSASVVMLTERLDVLNFLVTLTDNGNKMERMDIMSVEQQVLRLARERPCQTNDRPPSQTDSPTKWYDISLPLCGINTAKSLSTILSDCLKLIPSLGSTIKSRAPDGSVYNLTVQRESVTVAATSMRTLCHIALGLRSRLHTWGHDSSSPMSVSSVSKFVKQYQELQHELALASQSAADVFTIYTKLRSLGLPN